MQTVFLIDRQPLRLAAPTCPRTCFTTPRMPQGCFRQIPVTMLAAQDRQMMVNMVARALVAQSRVRKIAREPIRATEMVGRAAGRAAEMPGRVMEKMWVTSEGRILIRDELYYVPWSNILHVILVLKKLG